ncbi:ATP-binding protein [Helicobacter saguini]|uniref:ATP-binding protein n=1 Tax=Helicobacter saguini TaxID=1548018 RepID=A0A347VPT9_9HELI|nr:7-cyano-7-deazaguanine synthase [Helicobacter saguini]MWV61216.1 ATP-binding protein [Helicobacter saguini]MWV68117.1 ATP-binding protein [Helicobacter saguini]MWV70419.1 ATP-binding protein [Helicobacter saguini]MWV72320.1 ATP-binding protein [Helicobacter saguini]TLD92975.1 ATP-binding protein [Helicobacter saguini]
MKQIKQKKAVALFSGGLDSMISMQLMAEQGIKVYALNFNIGFGSNKDKSEYFKNAAAQVGAELIQINIAKQFFDNVLFKPKFGYGRFFNPCIDCHANMFRHAFAKMVELGADFAISGEVLGQRPKSQRRDALDQVRSLVRKIGEDPLYDKILSRDGSDDSKPRTLDELILRPMCAKLLAETFPEKKGWVDREKLLNVSGRGRHVQLALLEKYGWKYHEKPGGGCLLTDTSVSLKIKDMLSHRDVVFDDVALFKVGRYMVLENGARLVIARNDEENKKLDISHEKMDKIVPLNVKGPLALLDKSATTSEKELACKIVLSYCKAESDKKYDITLGDSAFSFSPLAREQASKYLFLKA